MVTKIRSLIVLFLLLGGLLIFHLLVFAEIIPYDQVWGGKLESIEDMRAFELLAIAVNLVMLVVYYLYYQSLKRGKDLQVLRIFIWIFFVYFLLNIFGNFFAESKLEMFLGTTFSFLAMSFTYVILKGKEG